MPITEKQLEARQKHIGSSDMPKVLLGRGYEVWLEKTGRIEPMQDRPEWRIGRMLENAVLDWAQAELGAIARNQYRSAPEYHLGANIDGILRKGNIPVEAKTAGWLGPLEAAWGEDGTDQVPDPVIIQCQVEMICAGKGQPANFCYVPAFLGGRGFAMYQVPYDEQLAKLICAKAVELWQYVEKDTEPPLEAPVGLDVLKRVHRVPNKVVRVQPETLNRWLTLKAEAKAAEKAVQEAQAELLVVLGDAEAGDAGDAGMATYFEQIRHGLDTKRLKAEDPTLYEQYSTETTYRVFRYKKPKGE